MGSRESKNTKSYHSCRSNSKAYDETADGHLGQAEGCCLEDCAYCEEYTAGVDGDLAAVFVSGKPSEDGTEEGSPRGDESDELLVWRSQVLVIERGADVNQDSAKDPGVQRSERLWSCKKTTDLIMRSCNVRFRHSTSIK